MWFHILRRALEQAEDIILTCSDEHAHDLKLSIVFKDVVSNFLCIRRKISRNFLHIFLWVLQLLNVPNIGQHFAVSDLEDPALHVISDWPSSPLSPLGFDLPNIAQQHALP